MFAILIFKWDHRLDMGVPLLDNQHEQVFEHANAFFICLKCGKGEKAIHECLDFLGQYVLYHFQTEEAFMVDTEYPAYREHQAKHKALATQVKFFSVKLESSHCEAAAVEEFRVFVTDWIAQHILEEDRAFAEYYKAYRKQHAKPSQPTPA